MRYSLLLALALLVVVGCGKNDAFVPLSPLGYAPPPAQFPNPGGYPGGYPGGGYSGGYFTPQMPGGYPNQYYPFLPVHNYFQSNPQLQNYWGGFWNQWQNYANYHQYNQYDFNRFWFEYCPQAWGQGSYANLYGYFNQNVYHWATPQTQFNPSADPNYFWQHYDGYSYSNLDSYGYCYDYCY